MKEMRPAAPADSHARLKAIIDRLQVIALKTSGMMLLSRLRSALAVPIHISRIEVVVLRSVVAQIVSRLVDQGALNGRCLGRLLQASSAAELHTRLGELLTATDEDQADDRIERVLDHVRQHYRNRQATRLAVLAAIAHVSPSHLSRLVRENTGEGLVSHLRKLRIAHAVQLVSTGCGGLREVAREVGYTHQADFCRDFRRVMGVTPGRFARSRRRTWRSGAVPDPARSITRQV